MPSRLEETPVPLDALIIGAGFGGCYLLHQLRKQGFRARIYEESDGLGGIWRTNRYPGARVDTCTPCYEYSDPEIWDEWEWTEIYPSQKEILRYFDFVDRKWDLRRDVAFGTRVTDAVFEPAQNLWRVNTTAGAVTARFFLPAIGFAAKPYTPPLPGLDTFRGFSCHTARWPEPKDAPDFVGRRIGVIGTGATGVQVIQELGPAAGRLVVFQRQPNCALPMRQRAWRRAEQGGRAARVEEFRGLRASSAGTGWASSPRRALDDTPAQRARLWGRLWAEGGWAPCHGNYCDFSTSAEANGLFYEFWRDRVRERLGPGAGPELLELLAPWRPPFPFGTKRPSLEQSFYEVFAQENVSIVPLLKNPIVEVVPEGVALTDGTVVELDALILATGFDAITGGWSRINIQGLDGVMLGDKWAKGLRTSMGISTSGFPNMFFLYGPQSPTASAAGPVTLEVQSDWIIQAMVHMRKNGLKRVDASLDAEDRWVQHAHEECHKTLMPYNTTTWYMGGNIPGKRREVLQYVGGLPRYIEALEESSRSQWSDFLFC